MATIKKCDRCGQELTDKTTYHNKTGISMDALRIGDDKNYAYMFSMDICKDCIGSFLEWFHRKGEESDG